MSTGPFRLASFLGVVVPAGTPGAAADVPGRHDLPGPRRCSSDDLGVVVMAAYIVATLGAAALVVRRG